MSTNKKKPIYITLAATIVLCIITFFVGFVISSVAFLDSRLEAAREENAELTQSVKEKESEIKTLKQTIEQKDENNIILGEQIQAHLSTIDSLNTEIEALKNDVNAISEAAVNSTLSEPATSEPLVTFASLSSTQQFILLIILFILILVVVSVTCIIISSKSSAKPEEKTERKHFEKSSADASDESSVAESIENAALPENDKAASEAPDTAQVAEENTASEEKDEEKPVLNQANKTLQTIDKAIDYLYRNKLEEHITELGGFKFGITNFDEVLSDKSKGKSFGNSENGDFVAFMSSQSSIKKLYIIPRAMVLSDSTVSLRGITDLFNIKNEAGDVVVHGTVKVKTVDAPAVFACGENGWAIESKGQITALGIKTL